MSLSDIKSRTVIHFNLLSRVYTKFSVAFSCRLIVILKLLVKYTRKSATRLKSTRVQNLPSQIREPLTDRGLGVTVRVKNK